MTSPTRRIRLEAVTTEDGRGLARLRDDLQKAAKGVDSLGDSMGTTEDDAKSLEAQILRTKKEIRNLGEEFQRTGDTSLFKDLGKQRRILGQLERIKKEAADDGDSIGETLGVHAGRSASKRFGEALDLGGSGIRPRNALIGAVVAAVAMAAPTLGAMIAGAVTGVAGLGGIAGGIAAASRSPAVATAARNFSEHISASFFQMGDEFVEPLVGAFDILKQGWDNLDLESSFEKVAGYVDDLAYGLAGFAKGFMTGFDKALDRAGPALEILARELPDVGGAIGYMFERIAAGKGTLEGLEFLLGAIEYTAQALGHTIGWLSDQFHNWVRFMAGFAGMMEDVPLNPFRDEWAQLNDTMEEFISRNNVGQQVLNGTGRELQNTAASARETADAIGKMNDEMFEAQNAALALSNATLAYEADLIRLKQQVKDTGHSLDRTTEAGNQNRQMINRMIQDLIAERDAAIEAAKGNEQKVQRAKAAYNKQIQKLQELLIRLGFEEAEIGRIIARYKQIPTRVYTKIIQDYETRGVPAGEHSGVRIAETRGRASGGPVLPGVPYTINERGRETVTFPARGTVHPASLTPAGNRPVVVQLTIGQRVIRQVLIDEALMRGIPQSTVRAAYP